MRTGGDAPIEMCGIDTRRTAVATAVHEMPLVPRGPHAKHLAHFIHSDHTGAKPEFDGNHPAEQGAIVWGRYPIVSGIPEVGVQGHAPQ